METLKKCEYCGKPYKEKEFEILGTKKVFQVATCNCSELLRKKAEDEELLEQKKRRIEKLFKNSMITPYIQKRTFATVRNTKEIQACYDYAKNFDPKTSKGLQFIGYKGTGKTTALACICNELIQKGHPCLFTTFSELLNRFSNYSYNHAGDISPLLDNLCQCEFVVLDDLGRETYTDRRKEFAFMIIDRLMNYEVTTAFTANADMLAKLTNIVEWDAILDRLKEMCPVSIQFKGQSMRGKNEKINEVRT